MSNFNIGQEVVCVDGYTSINGMKLVEGDTYIVKGTNKCCSPSICVGFISDFTTTCYCGYRHKGFDWWHKSSRFVSLEEYEEMNEAVESMKDVIQPKVLVER